MSTSPPTKRLKHHTPSTKPASDVLNTVDASAVAVRYNNMVMGLQTQVPHDCHKEISAVTIQSSEGARIYKRSLIFLLGAAAHRCDCGPLGERIVKLFFN